MFKRIYITVPLAAFLLAGFCQAQPGGPIAVPAPDPGTIVGTPSSDPTKTKCWVSRSYDSAVAVSVYVDEFLSKPVAKVRQYNKTPAGFVAKPVVITPAAPAAPITLDVMPVRLKKKEDAEERLLYYEMYYDAPAPGGAVNSILVGWLKYEPGNGDRSTSDAVIRLSSKVSGGNPCDEPPADDMGEEEEVTASATNEPGATIPLVPASPDE